ncbi:Cwf15 Cwc15 cell cycle control protein [Lactarius deliciosus]|nr:Cwf15 Cwc15 cell cycle control protein [Lactarius deliciosus]
MVYFRGTGYLAPKTDPAQAIEVKGGSHRYSVRVMAAHTKPKFRQPGQTSVDEVKALPMRGPSRSRGGSLRQDAQDSGFASGRRPMASEDEEAKKRRKSYKRDSDEGDSGGGDGANDSKGNANGDSGGEEEDDGDDDDEDDDAAELLRELERIKRERAAEQACVEQAEAEATEAEQEARIATANPLLNLAAALGNTPGINTTAPGTFAVKRRWDDGPPYFKNQAIGDKPQGQFVNDLLRTEKFMSRFIK